MGKPRNPLVIRPNRLLKMKTPRAFKHYFWAGLFGFWAIIDALCACWNAVHGRFGWVLYCLLAMVFSVAIAVYEFNQGKAKSRL